MRGVEGEKTIYKNTKVEKQGMHLRHVFELVQRPAASVESPAQALMPLLLGYRIALSLFLVIGMGGHNSCIGKTPSKSAINSRVGYQ
jgi:hypothetical protein